MISRRVLTRWHALPPALLGVRRLAGALAPPVKRSLVKRRTRRAGATGDGQLLLDSYSISPANEPLGGALGDMGLATFLDLDPAIQYRYLPVFTPEYLEQAGYTPDQSLRILNYLYSRDPNTLSA